jgi:ferredoxin
LHEDDLTPEQDKFYALNQELAELWPNINQSKPALPDADEWQDVADKLQYLER